MTITRVDAVALDIRGTVTECEPMPSPVCEKVVYQGTAPGAGNISHGGQFDRQRRAYVIPTDPRTPAQVTRRSYFADAVASWQSLSPDAKDAWKQAGKSRNLPGYSAFLSAYLRGVP